MNTGASSLLRLKILVCTLAAASAYGQSTGSLQFCNDCLPSPPDRLVRDVNGNPLVGTTYVAQLYYGGSPFALQPTTAAPARFKVATTPAPGTWQRSTRNIPAPAPGPYYLQVKVWDTAVAPTYEQAAASPTGQYGQSEIFSYNPCPNPPQFPPPGCDLMLNFHGFTLGTNPSPNVLVIREHREGGVELLYQGTHTVERAATIRGPWFGMGIRGGPLVDRNAEFGTMQFYRINDGGTNYSQNMVGWYRVDACRGFTMIANQFNAPGGNAVTNILKSPPEGTAVYKFDASIGGYVSLTYFGGGWEGDDLAMTLNPGDGAFLESPSAQTHRFLGDVQPTSLVRIVRGFQIISSALPEAGNLTDPAPGGLGFPPAEGDVIYQYSCAIGGYIMHEYFLGEWLGDTGPEMPRIAVGESFWLNRPTGAPGNWQRSFSVGVAPTATSLKVLPAKRIKAASKLRSR
jgi:hypothetical protein